MSREVRTSRIAVIGPAGFGGSYLCVELLQRGHTVIGLSRLPEKLGSHANYHPRRLDIDVSSIEELADSFKDCDVLVSMYGPHTAGHEALQYMPFIETVRKIILSVKLAQVKYFVMVGGTGSLHVPNRPVGECAVDNPNFFLAYRRALADSHAHVSYMEERLGPMGSSLRQYRNARIALRSGTLSDENMAVIKDYESKLLLKDAAADFIKAGRSSYLFFDGNTSFRWTYVSPSALYRPGKRTGTYEIVVDELPLKDCEPASSNPLDGRLLGISVADLSIAIADEIEQQKYVGVHWTAVGDLSDDTPMPSYVVLGAER